MSDMNTLTKEELQAKCDQLSLEVAQLKQTIKEKDEFMEASYSSIGHMYSNYARVRVSTDNKHKALGYLIHENDQSGMSVNQLIGKSLMQYQFQKVRKSKEEAERKRTKKARIDTPIWASATVETPASGFAFGTFGFGSFGVGPPAST